MESLCTVVCNETNTKYTCIICEVFVCNKCAKAASENVDGYNEELKHWENVLIAIQTLQKLFQIVSSLSLFKPCNHPKQKRYKNLFTKCLENQHKIN